MNSAAFSLIGDLEEAIARGQADVRVNTLRRITDLFAGVADMVSGDQVDVFDEVISRLAADIEVKARAELSSRLAPLPAGPSQVLRMLASDENIDVAKPILAESEHLDETVILDVAKARGQEHLLAISQRRMVTSAITDVLVERGNAAVLRSVVGNHGAEFSDKGFTELVKKSAADETLAIKVAARGDIPPEHFSRIVMRASDTVLRKLRATNPHLDTQITNVVAGITAELRGKNRKRDYSDAMKVVQSLFQGGKLDGDLIATFAKAGKFEETAASLSLLCRLPIETVVEVMDGENRDTVLILAKAADLPWSAAKLILSVDNPKVPPSPADLDKAEQNFSGLTIATAQRVLRFIQVRLNAGTMKLNA